MISMTVSEEKINLPVELSLSLSLSLYIYIYIYPLFSHGLTTNVLNCEFELQSHYYVQEVPVV